MNVFSSGGKGRAAERRRDAAWVEARARHPDARFVPVSGGRSLVEPGHPPRAALLSAAALGGAAPGPDERILLGETGEGALFAFEAPGEAVPGGDGAGEWVDLHRFGALLPAEEASLLAQARGMTTWHLRHRFCGDCGAPTRSEEAGHLRVCTGAACGARHFPRTDPAVIVLVTSGDRCLLARQAAWRPGVYAALAGFVEPGESLEDAVAREVREETGVELAAVRYHSSQPWPFPSSLMLGFTAEARTEAIRLDPEELEDARWFSRAELAESLRAGRVLPPSAVSIAHALLRDWLGPPL